MDTGTGTGGAGGGITTGAGGNVINTGSGGGLVVDPPGGGGGACQQAEVKFEPKIPTVYVMVDRSGSMFDCQSTTNRENSCDNQADTAWVKLREASLEVIRSLQAEVRFGFAAFTGSDPAHGGTCPQIDEVSPDFNNADKIAMVYSALPFQPNTQEAGKKFETPAGQALTFVGDKLSADTAPGDKFVLFVTDGQPDYCDDSNSLCAPDSVIWSLQSLKAKNISTIVMGLSNMGVTDLPAGILDAFANAGAGEPTKAPLREGLDAFAFYDQCASVTGWGNDLTASGKPKMRGTTLGTYSATAGPTKPYTPNAADQANLVTQLTAALTGVKSCTFDLQGKIEVDLTKAGDGKVSIDGTQVPFDINGMNGWRMVTKTQLELVGSGCETWRSTGKKINFDFPCDIIIVVR